MEFPSPKLKRKKGAGDLRRLLKEEEEEQINGQQCRGILLGSSVIIESESDISTLLRLGFYGKGVFSRSFPTHVSSTRSRDSEYSSSGGRVGDETRRKRARHDISQSEASEEQRKRRRLLLHAEWIKEKHRLLSLLTETDSVDVTEKMYTPVGLSSTTEDREVPTEVEDGESTRASYSPTTTGRGVNEIGVNEVGAQATLELKSRSETPAEDPYPVTEPLCLMAEEAFYLAAELKILRVSLPPPPHPSTLHLSPDQLWTRLCEEFSRFPFTYAAYRHYRRKGWVPKTGLKFGVDFILYKDGPDLYHSSYAVLVCEYFEEASETCVGGTVSAGSGEKLRWMDAVAHCRVCESTAKELVVVHVIVPRDCEETGLRSSPDTVDRLTLSETLVTRWVPDKDR